MVAEFSNEYSYSTPVVDGDFMKLIAQDELYEEFEKYAKKNYKLNRPWLQRLSKRGAEWQRVIDSMTQTGTGAPTLKGPTLADIGYTPEQIEEEAYAH